MELSSQHSHFTPSHLTHWARHDFYTEVFKIGIEMENVCDWVRSSLPPLINPSLFDILKWNMDNTSDKLGLAKPTRKGIQKTAPFRLAGGYTQKSDLSRALCLFLFLFLHLSFLIWCDLCFFRGRTSTGRERGKGSFSTCYRVTTPFSTNKNLSFCFAFSWALVQAHTHF